MAFALPDLVKTVENTKRSAAINSTMPELIDLEDFDPDLHQNAAHEVNVFAQSNPDYQFLVNSSGLGDETGFVVPIFSALADVGEKSVKFVLLVDDLAAYDAWVADNVIGTARIGQLHEINGRVIDGRGFRASIRVTLRDAGLEQIDPLVVIEPFIGGRAAALAPLNDVAKVPMTAFVVVAFLITGFGFVFWNIPPKGADRSFRLSGLGQPTGASADVIDLPRGDMFDRTKNRASSKITAAE